MLAGRRGGVAVAFFQRGGGGNIEKGERELAQRGGKTGQHIFTGIFLHQKELRFSQVQGGYQVGENSELAYRPRKLVGEASTLQGEKVAPSTAGRREKTSSQILRDGKERNDAAGEEKETLRHHVPSSRSYTGGGRGGKTVSPRLAEEKKKGTEIDQPKGRGKWPQPSQLTEATESD